MVTTSESSWSFSCTACGKCCDSAPRVSLPELFHHQTRFIGELSIRRVPREVGPHATEARELGASFFFPLGRATDQDVFLFTSAFHYSSLGRCPALGQDGSCGVHGNRKPLVCEVVPLEATLPESLQARILSERARELAEINCIQGPFASADVSPQTELVRHLRVVSGDSRSQLLEAQAELVRARRYWGEAVHRLLEPELLRDRATVERIPVQGALTLSLAPVLATVAEASPACHARVLDYVAAQQTLIGQTAQQALARKDSRDRAETGRLRAAGRAYDALALSLRQQGPRPTPSSDLGREAARAVEAWLLS
jgi:Fe-S-cluster containining protein